MAGAEPGGWELVVSQAPGYALRAGPDVGGAVRFATLVGQAQAAGDLRTRAGVLAEALALWPGAGPGRLVGPATLGASGRGAVVMWTAIWTLLAFVLLLFHGDSILAVAAEQLFGPRTHADLGNGSIVPTSRRQEV